MTEGDFYHVFNHPDIAAAVFKIEGSLLGYFRSVGAKGPLIESWHAADPNGPLLLAHATFEMPDGSHTLVGLDPAKLQQVREPTP
jgi:hypothetical protein